MCFYRDTQAALAQNNLRNLIKQRTHVTTKSVKSLDSDEADLKVSSEPYKKLHLTKNLYQDLLQLSASEIGKFEDPSTDDSSQSGGESPETGMAIEETPVISNTLSTLESINQRMMSIREDLQTNLLPETMKKYHIEGKYMNSSDAGFYENLLNIVEQNNLALSGFKDTQDKIGVKIDGCLKSARVSSSNVQNESPFERLEKASQNEKYRQKYNSNPSYYELLSHFTNGRTEFPYELVLSAEIAAPVFRERNIKIEVSLVRKSDNSIVQNHGKMLLQMSLHTWELPPNAILRNKAGNKVLQGEDECELKNGQAVFDKIQINEVTSKFINGSIALFVTPKRPVNFGTSLESLHLKNSVRIEDIKPLLVSKLIVKSKKKNTIGKKTSPGDDN